MEFTKKGTGNDKPLFLEEILKMSHVQAIHEDDLTFIVAQESPELVAVVREKRPMGFDHVQTLKNRLAELENLPNAPVDGRTINMRKNDDGTVEFNFKSDCSMPVFGLLKEKDPNTPSAHTILVVLCAANEPHKIFYQTYFNTLFQA